MIGNAISVTTKTTAGMGKSHRTLRSTKLPVPMPASLGEAVLLRFGVEQGLELVVGVLGDRLHVLALDSGHDDAAADVAGLADLHHQRAVIALALRRRGGGGDPVGRELRAPLGALPHRCAGPGDRALALR